MGHFTLSQDYYQFMNLTKIERENKFQLESANY